MIWIIVVAQRFLVSVGKLSSSDEFHSYHQKPLRSAARRWAKGSQGTMDNLRQKHILVVDDEPAVLSILSQYLKDEGFSNISTARDGLECLSVLEQLGEKVYVILLDLNMPNMNGIEVVRHLVNVHKHIIGIVVLTGYVDLLPRKLFMKMGTDRVIAANYITKPYDVRNLIAEVDKTLALVHDKRKSQLGQISKGTADNVQSISEQLTEISERLERLDRRIPTFFGQLGLDVKRTIAIGLLIIMALYFGLGDFLVNIIRQLK